MASSMNAYSAGRLESSSGGESRAEVLRHWLDSRTRLSHFLALAFPVPHTSPALFTAIT